MNLKKKMTIIFSTLMASLLILVSCAAYFYTEKMLLTSVESGAQAITNASSKELDGWLLSKAMVLKTTAATVQQIAGDKTPITMQMLTGFKQVDPEINDLYFGRASDGAIIDGSGWIPPAGFDARTRSWYKDAINSGKLTFGEPYLDSVTNKMALSVTIPFKNSAGETVGVLSEDLLMDTMFATIAKIRPFEGSFAFLLNQTGTVMAYPDANMQNKNIKDLAPLKPLYTAVQSIEKQTKGLTTYTIDGKEYLMVFEKLPSTQWLLGISIPVAVIYAPLESLRWIFIIGTVLALFIVIPATLFIASRIAKPLELLKHQAEKVAAGDFTQRVDIEGKDEIAALADVFNQMRDALRSLIRKVQEKSEHMAAASEELTASAEQTAQAATQVAVSITNVAEGAHKQMISVEEASSIATTMSNNVKLIAQDSDTAVDGARLAAKQADQGTSDVDIMVKNMLEIEESVSSSAQVISKLGEQSKRIGQITDTISSIASQTNLLALNAAIEAARAGEQGRGFAVVAEEVRKLAEEVQKAAQKISEEIAMVQKDTEAAVISMATGNVKVKAGVDSVHLVGTNLKSIATLVHNSSSGMENVRVTLNKIIDGSQRIDASVKTIDSISQASTDEAQMVSAAAEEQLASMDEISSASKSLAQMAQELQNAIAVFKI